MPARYEASVESEGQPGEVRPGGAAGRRYENRMRKLWCDAARGVLKLEAVAEDEVVSLAPVLAEILVELRWRLRFDVADLGAEGVANLAGAPGRRPEFQDWSETGPGVRSATLNGASDVSLPD